MVYRIKSSLLHASKSFKTGKPIEKPIHETLAMYDRGEDLLNSPFIQNGEWCHHKDCWLAGNTLESAYCRQEEIIKLYLNMRQNGYNGSTLLVWFDDEGFIRLYDGFTRIAIMNYLGLSELVNVETDWQGVDKSAGRDFPLVDVLLSEEPRGKWLYQPIGDDRVRGWGVARPDSKARLQYILNNLVGSTVLDIGCSEGYFSREIAKKGYKVTAIDRSPGMIAAARYLSTLEGIEVDYRVGGWGDIVDQLDHSDNILFLSVIHNDMKVIGVEEGLKRLESLEGKASKVFFEVPNSSNERQWMKPGYPQFNFHRNIQVLEQRLGMVATDSFAAMRRTYQFSVNGKSIAVSDEWINQPGREHYRPLFKTLGSIPCRNIMEIGVFDGASAIAMIKKAAKNVPEDEICFYGFDLFEDMTPQLRDEEFSFRGSLPPKMEDVQKKLEASTKAKIILIKGNTRETLRKSVKRLPKMDLIYIDGGHTIETTRNDWQCSLKLMHKDTVVYFDDCCDEMPFIGSLFIKGELSDEFQARVMPETDYYQRKFGRFKAQLLRVEKRKPVAKQIIEARPATNHFRFHLLGLPHSVTRKDETMCAFTQLVYRLSQMLAGLGHEVYHYGTEGSDVPCTEHIDVLTQEVQKQAYGDWTSRNQLWVHNGNDLAYRTFRKNAIEEIRGRAKHRDMILISNGSWLAEVGSAFPAMQAIEPIVGYIGSYSEYRVFPSYAWMHHMVGRQCEQRALSRKIRAENFATGSWYDAVIPHFFNPDEFTFSSKKDDYYAFLGRLIARKGPHIAADMTKRLGARLVVAGQPLYPDEPRKTECLRSLGLIQPHIEYIGTVGLEERSKLLTNARAVIIPSLYFEPFGLVAVEALLSGTPVITTDWGSFPEIIPQGEVGYRCRTMDDFLWAARNIDKIDPKRCREYAVANFSMDRVAKAYQEYFTRVQDRYENGWYQEHPGRTELDWLRRY